MYHTAAVCPPDVKRAWIDLIGPERVYEGYGATEEVGLCAIRGDEWLKRPGSVGRPVDTEIKIIGPDGRQCPPGEVGEVFMRRISLRDTYTYRGAEAANTDADGFTSVGDLAWVDEDGYLYPADRRVDLIITGGSNVYPAEVETMLLQHRDVDDVAVVGLPDPEWGHRVHAIVQPHAGASPSADELSAFCRERLQPYKVPKTFELVEQLPRDAAGKLRRANLVRERTAGG
jgi:bile acid-coenzyme A ligase